MIDICMAGYDDCDELLELEMSCFNYERLSKLRFLYHIQNRNCYLLLARIKGQLAGYGMLLFHSKRSRGRIYSICTSPMFRRQGVATKLLSEIERIAARKGKGLYLEVRTENSNAQKLYKHLGFSVSSRKKAYYLDGGDALVMTRDFRKGTPSC